MDMEYHILRTRRWNSVTFMDNLALKNSRNITIKVFLLYQQLIVISCLENFMPNKSEMRNGCNLGLQLIDSLNETLKNRVTTYSREALMTLCSSIVSLGLFLLSLFLQFFSCFLFFFLLFSVFFKSSFDFLYLLLQNISIFWSCYS